ncbi:MAG TPA: hypothetical protein VGE66_18365 [Chitinophagaceae bacterium]
MRKVISRLALGMAITATTLTACKKDKDAVPAPPPPPQGEYAVKVKAAITVGDVVYDSIPATFTITSWDRSGVMYQRDVQLAAGTQTVYLPKAHTKYRIQLAKWGITDVRTLLPNELNEAATYVLGGSKAAKKIREEVHYTYENESFRPQIKRAFVYDNDGKLAEVQNYGNMDGYATDNMELYSIDRFGYTGNKLEDITTFDQQDGGAITGFNRFAWTTEGKLNHIQFANQNEQSSCRIFYPDAQGNNERVYTEFYLNDLSLSSNVELKFKGGNRVEEKTTIPNYPAATRTYTYDAGINPYVFLKWPTMNFTYDSKNNVVEEKYSNVSIRIEKEYTYDADGFVKEVLKKEINTANNGVRGISKTVYSY